MIVNHNQRRTAKMLEKVSDEYSGTFVRVPCTPAIVFVVEGRAYLIHEQGTYSKLSTQ